MKRKIIEINESLCNGCGQCVPDCHEGALQIIDGKARLISDLFCDGLGACINTCPLGAINVIEREAEPYDEVKTLEANIIKGGENVIKAHLKHLLEHNETGYYKQAIKYLTDHNIPVPRLAEVSSCSSGGCPGSKVVEMSTENSVSSEETSSENINLKSQLTHWPVQLHLINPEASLFDNEDLLISADCTAFSFGNFHAELLKNKKLIIACPKLDSGLDSYIEKIKVLSTRVNTITVVIMEVPCCSGLIGIVKKAVSESGKKIPVKQIVMSIKGEILKNEWL